MISGEDIDAECLRTWEQILDGFRAIAANAELEKMQQWLKSWISQLHEREAVFEFRFWFEREKQNYSAFATKEEMPLSTRWAEELHCRTALNKQEAAGENRGEPFIESTAEYEYRERFVEFFVLNEQLRIAAAKFVQAFETKDSALQSHWLREWKRLKESFVRLGEEWLNTI